MNKPPSPNDCPETIKRAFIEYRENGTPPGDFVRACLENNLMEAFKRADDDNREALPHIVAWLYWEMPLNIFKSRENIQKHLASFQEEPEPELDEPALHDVSARWDGGLHNRPATEHDCR